jgi:hemoglobin
MEAERDITEEEIALLVERFYAKVRKDPEIGPVFNDAVQDWDEHIALLKNFWSSVLLASGRYKGSPMMAHLPLPIERQFFDRWLQLFAETAHEVMPASLAFMVIGKAERIADTLKLGLYAYKPDSHLAAP